MARDFPFLLFSFPYSFALSLPSSLPAFSPFLLLLTLTSLPASHYFALTLLPYCSPLPFPNSFCQKKGQATVCPLIIKKRPRTYCHSSPPGVKCRSLEGFDDLFTWARNPSQQGTLGVGGGLGGQAPFKQDILVLPPNQAKGGHYPSSRMFSGSKWEIRSHCLSQQGLTRVSLHLAYKFLLHLRNRKRPQLPHPLRSQARTDLWFLGSRPTLLPPAGLSKRNEPGAWCPIQSY